MSSDPSSEPAPILMQPIGRVLNSRLQVQDDHWGGLISRIVIDLGAAALQGLEEFSHAGIIFYFDRVEASQAKRGARRPRGSPAWPQVGILAQRAKGRPNRLGLTIVKILKREGNILTVSGLDAVDGSPVLDIKPVMREFLPEGPLRQPAWVEELMQDYWKEPQEK